MEGKTNGKGLGVRPLARLVLGLSLLVALGTGMIMLPWSSTDGIAPLDAMFTAVSALTVTGLGVITTATDLTLFGHVMLILLIQIGGVGYMVLAVMFFRLIGRKISLLDRSALKESLGLVSISNVVELTRQVFFTVLIIEAVGATLLTVHWSGMMPLPQAAFYGAFHGVSAFCNAGFDLFNGNPQFPAGLPNDDVSLVIMGTLIFLGGLGIPVLFDLIRLRKTRRLSLHSQITLRVVATLVIAGAVAFFLSEYVSGGVLIGQNPVHATVMSLFQSVSARTAGFAVVGNFDRLEPATELVMMSLMFVGCAPASMGGGITTGTLSVMVLALWAFVRGQDTAVFKGKAIPGQTVRKASAVLTISILVVISVTWLISVTHSAPLDVVGFEVISAFATCGLSLGFTSELDWFGRLLIMFTMFWGRLGALTIIVSLAGIVRTKRIRYPEDRVLIG
jgi:trk system potassium uptake protein